MSLRVLFRAVLPVVKSGSLSASLSDLGFAASTESRVHTVLEAQDPTPLPIGFPQPRVPHDVIARPARPLARALVADVTLKLSKVTVCPWLTAIEV